MNLSSQINDDVCDFLENKMKKEVGSKGPWGKVKITKKELLDEFLPKFINSKLFEDSSIEEIEETIIRQAKFFMDGWNKGGGSKLTGYKYKFVDNKDHDFIHIDIDKWSKKHIENIDELILWFDMFYFKDRAIIKEFTALEVKYADEWNKVNLDLEKFFEMEDSQSALNPEILAPILKISDYCCFKLLKTIQENNGKLIVAHDYLFKSIFYEKIFTQKKDTFKTVDNIFLDKIYNMTKIFYYYHFKNYKTNSSTATFEQNNQLLLDQYENILKQYNKHFSVEGLFDID